jgi:hypothetical protein
MIVEHSNSNKHLIYFNHTKFLGLAPDYLTYIIREVLEIEKRPNNFNYENGYKLNKS